MCSSYKYLASLFSITFFSFQPLFAAPGEKLIYFPVEPCRIVNTISSSIGSIDANTTENFLAYGGAGELNAQGGELGGCQHPKATTGIRPTAIAANVTAVGVKASGSGNLVAFPAGSTLPASSLINYKTGTNIANSTIIKLCQGVSCTSDFSIQSNISTVPAIVDVQGYFYELPSGIATVAKSGGDYSSPVDALADTANWCGTPSATNRCLIKIAPGVYNITDTALEMKPYIDIQGSGKNMTLLQGPVAVGTGWAKTNAVVWGASNSTLSDLSVENIGGTGNAAAVYNNSGASPRLERVRLEASGAIENAVHNNNSASPMIIDSEMEVPDNAVAIYNYNNSNPTIVRCYINGGQGVYTKSSNATIEHSYIDASINTVINDSYYAPASTYVFATTLYGGPAFAYATGTTLIQPKCAAVTDENNTFSAGPVCP